MSSYFGGCAAMLQVQNCADFLFSFPVISLAAGHPFCDPSPSRDYSNNNSWCTGERMCPVATSIKRTANGHQLLADGNQLDQGEDDTLPE
jgi:hypothetical protein